MFSRKHVVVVYPRPEFLKDARFGYSVECLTLATLAKREGFVTEYFDFSIEELDEALFLCVEKFLSDIVVIIYLDSVPLHRSSNVHHGLALCDELKLRFHQVKIIACGPWCMLNRSGCSGADCTWHEEPERCFLRDFCGRDFNLSGESKLLPSIDDLPRPDRKLLPSLKNIESRYHLQKSAVVQTTRGCRNCCYFCPRQAWTERLIRHRRQEDCVDELSELADEGVRNVWIDDDNMGTDQSWSIDFFKRVEERMRGRGKLGLYFSTDVNVDASFFFHAQRAGGRIVSFGIESASERVQRYFKKPISTQRIVQAVSAADAAGLFTVGNFIVGSPVETEEDLLATKELIAGIPLDVINVKILSIIQGSPLWNELHCRGAVSGETICEFACAQNGTSPHDLELLKKRQKALYEVFESTKGRHSRMTKKIIKLGPPYFITEA